MQCSEFDALLSQAIDGTLAGEKLVSFETHARECGTCGPLLQQAESGRSWLKSLAAVEPPEELLTNILLETSGVRPARARGKTPWMTRIRNLAELIVSPVIGVVKQPRFAMSFGMAFFTLSVTMSVAGVKISDLRHLDLRPSAVRRSYYETSGRVVKYYENIRFVYEIESRVRQFKQSMPAAQPREDRNNRNRKENNKNNSSGQPDQKQERNYSQGGDISVYASLAQPDLQRADLSRVELTDPPVVIVDRRFV